MGRLPWLPGVLAITACGRLGFDIVPGQGGDAGDGRRDGGAVVMDGGFVASRETYLKASNTDVDDQFGISVAISGDGNRLAVGAWVESSGAVGIDGNQADNSKSTSGAVYVFVRSGATWVQEAYIKASNTDAGDELGTAVALSYDGTILAVGAKGEQSAATGVGGNQADNSANNAGAVYVFARDAAWTQQAYLKASNTGADDLFGAALALSGDGTTLAVGAYQEDSSATGVGGNGADNTVANSGAAYVFTRGTGSWSEQAYVKASNPGANDEFGVSVALSSDGSTLAVGADGEDSSATGIGGNQGDDNTGDSGAAYVFARSGSAWTQQAYVKASNTGITDQFGYSIALSGDSNTLAVGAPSESSASPGIGGDQSNNAAAAAGAVYVFTRAGTWTQQAYVKTSNPDTSDNFGWAVALSQDGSTLAATAWGEASSSSGLGGNPADNSLGFAGAFYVLSRSGELWSQRSYLKPSTPGFDDEAGWSVALSASGSTLIAGAYREDSNATGVGGDSTNDSAANAGAAYVIE